MGVIVKSRHGAENRHQVFVDKWKREIPDKDIYFSFNGHGHHRYINANDEGLIRFGLKNIEAALSDEKYTNIGGEYSGEDWIKEEDEDLSIHFIEKVNDDIEKHISNRQQNMESGAKTGKIVLPLIIAALLAPVGFVIYLFIFWLTH